MTRASRLRTPLALLVGIAALLGVAPSAAAKSYSADRFDVTARLLPDRSLTIEERIVFRFDGDYTYVFREIPRDRTDGVRDIEADMDGVRFPVGAGPGAIEVKDGRGRAVRITWRFAPATGVHAFTLRYRLAGVVTAEEAQDVLAWRVLPREHEYRIGEAHAQLALPAGSRLAVPPSLQPGTAALSMHDAGGDATEQIAATARDLRRNDTMRLEIRLAPGAVAPEPPAWQREAAERSRRGPSLLIVAAAVLAVGLGWIAAFWSAWRRSTEGGGGAAATHAGFPDAPLPVAVAARLAGRAVAQGPHYVATMMDLAARGVIAVDETPGGSRLRGRRFVARLVEEAPGLRPHEATWLDVAFGTGTPRETEVPLGTIQRRFTRARNAFTRAVQDEMRQGGLVDAEREAARRSLVRTGLVALGLAIAGVGLAVALVPTFGAWAAVVPASFALVAAAAGIAAVSFSVFTRDGERVAVRWRRYFAEVRRLAKDKRQNPEAIPADWLPYAIAAAVGAAWVRKLAAAPGRYVPPSWFHAAASGEDHSAAFVAFVGSHASSSAAGGAGGGGGAAAGGGSSGAG